MKMKIFLLLILCALTLNAQSKSTHKNLTGLTCKDCHSSNIPTKEKPSLKPCPREHMGTVDLPASKGPEIVTIDKMKNQTNVYTPVVFTHRLHAEMSGMSGGCKTCHHYNPISGPIMGCSDCHEVTRKRTDVSKPDLNGAYHRQCVDCHRAVKGKTDCVECHELNSKNTKTNTKDLAAVKAKKVHTVIETPVKIKFDTPKASGKTVSFFHEEHIKVFKIECQSCHKNENCIKCHSKNNAELLKSRTTEQKHSVCSTCHDTKSNCNSCHSDAPSSGFNHKAKTGFDISKYHSKLSCERCHIEKGKFEKINNECASCHGVWTKENFQHKVTGVILDETHSGSDCSDCHQAKNYSSPVCTNCHDDKSFPKNVPGKLVGKTAVKK